MARSPKRPPATCRRPRRAATAVIAAALALLMLALAPRGAAARRAVTVQVTGVRGALRANVLSTLGIANKGERKNASDAFIRHLHTRADAEIHRALEPFGYYRPFIHSELKTDGKWIARYDIDPGPPLRLDSVLVEVQGEGSADPAYQKLVHDFPLHKGDVLYQPAYEQAKTALENEAANGGYLDAKFLASDLNVDLSAYTSSIRLIVDSGRRHFFGDARFDQTVVSPRIANKFVTFHPGEPFSFRKLLEMQTALSSTGFYERVEVQPDTGEIDDRIVPIDVSLTPSRKIRLTSGVGYGTDDGPRATSQIELRRLNRLGHHAQIDLLVGQLSNGAAATYFIPWPNPRTDVASFYGGAQDVRTNVSRSQATLTGASLSRMLADWQVTLATNFRNETYSVGADHGTARFLVPEASWSRMRADDRTYTRNGDRVRIALRASARTLLSDANLLQPEAEWKVIRSFGPSFRGLARLSAGTSEVGNFHRLPPSLRYFAGGTNSVRGYAFNSLGPQDTLGRVIGGRNLLAGSLEANWLFHGKVGPALFVDAGNAFNRWSDGFKRGVGTGIRWVSPMGLIRGDLGWGLDRKKHPLEVHIALGSEL